MTIRETVLASIIVVLFSAIIWELKYLYDRPCLAVGFDMYDKHPVYITLEPEHCMESVGEIGMIEGIWTISTHPAGGVFRIDDNPNTVVDESNKLYHVSVSSVAADLLARLAAPDYDDVVTVRAKIFGGFLEPYEDDDRRPSTISISRIISAELEDRSRILLPEPPLTSTNTPATDPVQ